jgi:hypothetical protein
MHHLRDFRSPAIFEFFNTIGTFRTWRGVWLESVIRSIADVDYPEAARLADGCCNAYGSLASIHHAETIEDKG